MSDLEKMLEVAPNAEQKALVGACGFIGLRIGEACAFKTSWFDPSERMLRVRGKGDKERILPVSMRAWGIISEAYINAMQSDGNLIHYSDRSARKAITSLGRRAGITRAVSSHDLRATFATELANKGVPIRVVQELLGHSSVATTEIYTGVGVEAMKQAVILL